MDCPTRLSANSDPVQSLRAETDAVRQSRSLLVAVPFGVLLGQVITDGPATASGLRHRASGSTSRWRVTTVVIAVLEVLSFLGKPIFLLFLDRHPGGLAGSYRSRSAAS